MSEVDAEIATFLAKYAPSVALELREARAKLCQQFPRGFELVYDNYNALVFGISPTERTADAFVSVAGYPKWVTLFFLQGAKLKDPGGILEGEGKQVRSIRLATTSDMEKPEVLALIAQAALPYQAAFSLAPVLSTVIKSVSARQRPRRPLAEPPTSKTTRNRKPKQQKNDAGASH